MGLIKKLNRPFFLKERCTNASAKPGSSSKTLLPLNSPGRFRRDVVDHAVDALYLVDDAGGGAAQKFVIEGVIIRRHAIRRCHRAQGADELVGSRIAHHADALHRQQHGESLSDGVIQPGLFDFVEIDGVGFSQYFDFFRRDGAGDADRQARPGEGMTSNKFFR